MKIPLDHYNALASYAQLLEQALTGLLEFRDRHKFCPLGGDEEYVSANAQVWRNARACLTCGICGQPSGEGLHLDCWKAAGERPAPAPEGERHDADR